MGTPVEEEVLRVRGAGLGGELVKILWEGAEWDTGGNGTGPAGCLGAEAGRFNAS